MQKITIIRNKIITLKALISLRNDWKNEGKKVVFTNGCFDLIHLGHIDYLAKTADLGDKLIIGVNSDNSVKRIKGQGRPIKDENSRLMILASFIFTDAIVLFDEETPFSLINKLRPDVLVKGGDYKENEIVGAEIVKNSGGQLIILPFLEGYSTTMIENKIKDI